MPYRPRVQFEGQLPNLASIYISLDREEFRLLQVQGYDNFGILRCSLIHTPLQGDATIPYSAISYTWNESDKLWYGDYDTTPKPIRINGVAVMVPDKVANMICLVEKDDPELVPTKLHNSDRMKHSKKTIWIDAICINQENMEENGHQVARMGSIFGRASEVLSFLGSPSGETDQVIDKIINLSSTGTLNYEPSPKWTLAIVNFFGGHDYWRRAWIFQEIAMARTIVMFWGSKVVSLDTILGICEQLSENDKMEGLRGFIKALRLIRHSKPMLSRAWKYGSVDESDPSKYAMKGTRNTFLEVLRESRQHNACRDPRDMLYSRMAVATDTNVLIPYADYQMPVEELYKRFATNSIVRSNSLEVITFASSTAMCVPTWVPDWTSRNSGWITEAKHNAMKETLVLLQWRDIGLPRISRCRSEMMVQGKVLKTIQKRDHESLYFSAFTTLTHYAEKYPISEVPHIGDMICVLRDCPVLVYLRAVEQHFVVVDKASCSYQRLAY